MHGNKSMACRSPMMVFLFLQCWMSTKSWGRKRKKRSGDWGYSFIRYLFLFWWPSPSLFFVFELAVTSFNPDCFVWTFQDQKKINDQLAAEQEKLFGSKPSPARPQSSRKVAGARVGSGVANGTPVRRLSALQSGGRTASRDGRKNTGRPSAPVNYVAIAKEETASQVSSNHTGPSTPWPCFLVTLVLIGKSVKGYYISVQ